MCERLGGCHYGKAGLHSTRYGYFLQTVCVLITFGNGEVIPHKTRGRIHLWQMQGSIKKDCRRRVKHTGKAKVIAIHMSGRQWGLRK